MSKWAKDDQKMAISLPIDWANEQKMIKDGHFPTNWLSKWAKDDKRWPFPYQLTEQMSNWVGG